jgi:hypothetical protein
VPDSNHFLQDGTARPRYPYTNLASMCGGRRVDLAPVSAGSDRRLFGRTDFASPSARDIQRRIHALDPGWTLQLLRRAIPSDHAYGCWSTTALAFLEDLGRSIEALGIDVLKTPVRMP